MIHRLEIDYNCVVICGDTFLEEFNKLLKESFKQNNTKYDKA